MQSWSISGTKLNCINLNSQSACRGPDGLVQLIGLSARRCKQDAALLSDSDINKLRNQTPGEFLSHWSKPHRCAALCQVESHVL